MANDKSKKSNGNRYPGVDSASWVVKDTTGTQIGKESYSGFNEANGVAQTHINVTGLFAQAVRA